MTGHGFEGNGSGGAREVALRQLSIVDEEGKVTMRLDRNGIGIYGPGEKLQLLLGPSEEGGVIQLRDAAGRRRVAIDSRGQAGILVFGEDEKPRVVVRGGGEILIYDVEGTLRVILGRCRVEEPDLTRLGSAVAVVGVDGRMRMLGDEGEPGEMREILSRD